MPHNPFILPRRIQPVAGEVEIAWCWLVTCDRTPLLFTVVTRHTVMVPSAHGGHQRHSLPPRSFRHTGSCVRVEIRSTSRFVRSRPERPSPPTHGSISRPALPLRLGTLLSLHRVPVYLRRTSHATLVVLDPPHPLHHRARGYSGACSGTHGRRRGLERGSSSEKTGHPAPGTIYSKMSPLALFAVSSDPRLG